MCAQEASINMISGRERQRAEEVNRMEKNKHVDRKRTVADMS